MGRMLILFGGCLIVLGGIFLMAEKRAWTYGLGRLPGDVLIERKNFKFYFPLATSLLISAFFSFIVWLVRKK